MKDKLLTALYKLVFIVFIVSRCIFIKNFIVQNVMKCNNLFTRVYIW